MIVRRVLCACLATCALVVGPSISSASQVVSTYASGVTGVKDFVWDGAGQMYATGPGKLYTIGPGGSPVTVINSTFNNPWGITFGPDGNLYVADSGTAGVANDGKVYKVTPDGTKTTFATFAGDPIFLHFAPGGDLFVSEWSGRKLWKLSPAGVATLVASNLGSTGDQAADFVIEPSGNILIGVGPNILELSPAGTVLDTFSSGLGGVVAMLQTGAGDFYITRYSARDIWHVTSAGVGSHWAGVGGTCSLGDVPLETAYFNYTSGIHFRGGVLYIGASGCNMIKTVDFGDPARSSTWGRLKTDYR